MAIPYKDIPSSMKADAVSVGLNFRADWENWGLARRASQRQYYTSLIPSGRSFAQFLASIGDETATIYVNSEVRIPANLTIPDNISIEVLNGGSFNISTGVTLTMPLPSAGSYQIFTGAGAVRFSNGGEALPWWWGGSPSSTDNTAAIQAGIDAFTGTSGGLYFSDGTWDCLGGIAFPANFYWRADGSDETRVRYTGTTFQNFITVGSALTSTVNAKFIRIGLVGGLFQQGRARYVLHADWFNTGCLFEDVLIRDGVGLLYIGEAYLSSMRGVRIQSTTPDRTAAGITQAEWEEVHGDGRAPVMILNANAATMDTISIFRVGSEVSGGVTPYAYFMLSGAAFPETISLESCGPYTDGGTHNLLAQYGTVLGDDENGFVGGIGSHYYEACAFEKDALLTRNRTHVALRPFWYNITCDSYLLDNQGSGEVRLFDGEIYAGAVESLFHVLSSPTSLSRGSDVIFENVAMLPGARITDGSLPGGVANVFDATGTAYPMGTPDGGVRTGERLVCTPRIVSNLTLTTGTNGVGAYIDVLAGVFRREQGDFVSCAHPSEDADMVYIRLHPPTASRYYRLFIGRAGQPYLVEYASPQTEPKGNWITEFATDGSGAIGALTANPRLSVNGEYAAGRNPVRVLGTAVPTGGYWEQGDQVINTSPGALSPIAHWVCTTAGTPGTWRSVALAPLAFGSVTLVAGVGTVANTAVTSTTVVRYWVFTSGGTRGFLSYTNNAGVGFSINSTSATDTSVVQYEIVSY